MNCLDYCYTVFLPEISIPALCSDKEILPEIQFTCSYRGNYQVGCCKLVFLDYFKLFRFSKKINNTSAVFVYPAIKSINPSFSLTSQNQQEDFLVHPLESENTDVYDFRKYEDNDDIKKIHWKLSMKTDDLIVKKYAPLKKTSAVIALDFTDSGITSEKKKLEDSMAEAAISLIKYYVSKGECVEFVYNNSDMKRLQVNSAQDFHQAHFLCASLDFKSTLPFDQLIANYLTLNKTKPTFFLLSAFVSVELYEQIKQASMSGYKIIVVDFGKEIQTETDESIEDYIKESHAEYICVSDIIK